MLVASHAHSGTKEMGSQQKAEEAKQGFREEKKGPERGEGASTEAESSVLPSIVLWSRWLLPSFVVFSVACVLELRHSSCRPSTSLQTNPAASSTVSGPGELTAAVHSALAFPILVVALR